MRNRNCHPSLQVVKETYPALRELGLDDSCWIWPSITQVPGLQLVLSRCPAAAVECRQGVHAPQDRPPTAHPLLVAMQNAYQTAEVLAALHGVGRNRVRRCAALARRWQAFERAGTMTFVCKCLMPCAN